MSARHRAGVAHTAFIELYMLKREGQGDGGIFINGEILETEGIQAQPESQSAVQFTGSGDA